MQRFSVFFRHEPMIISLKKVSLVGFFYNFIAANFLFVYLKLKHMLKRVTLFLFVVFSISATTSFSQVEKINVNFYYSTKAGKSVDAEMVHFTFMVTGIKSATHYQELYNKFSKQDGIRKVDMSPYDATQESALCKFSFKKPATPEYVQKVLNYLGLAGVYIDNQFVPVSELSNYFGNKKKQDSSKTK